MQKIEGTASGVAMRNYTAKSGCITSSIGLGIRENRQEPVTSTSTATEDGM